MKILVNFKAYDKTRGVAGLEILKKIEEIDKKVIIAPQTCDLRFFAENTESPLYAQHVDPYKPGAKTGFLPPEIAAEICEGTLINHSEHPLPMEIIEKTVAACKEIGFTSMVCAADVEMVKKVSEFSPNFIAIEPPEMIGGDVSVSKAKPEIIEDSVKATEVPVLCGAGVNSGDDVAIAKKLGSVGILVASAVVKNPLLVKDFVEASK